jgi:CheY-like chemotaxis protein
LYYGFPKGGLASVLKARPVNNSSAAVHILVVEDRQDVRLSLMFLLEALGYAVQEAADGHEALRVMSKQRVDIVLTDLYMPGLDGLGLIRAIRALPEPRPYIIVISGSEHVGVEAARSAANDLGADAILVKPVNRQTLVQAIRDLGKRKILRGQ